MLYFTAVKSGLEHQKQSTPVIQMYRETIFKTNDKKVTRFWIVILIARLVQFLRCGPQALLFTITKIALPAVSWGPQAVIFTKIEALTE